ncbi:hypothetical protein CJ030_MR1G018150 [Morella rubra]|uniref:Uncharacterized protein n=1 Tax=Morella rubra TaxID=262757 RepID=A0A6A1WMQ9_9ROSI|nr:hypothetical protein CJ030_MR1G018150 [Morella rubra]
MPFGMITVRLKVVLSQFGIVLRPESFGSRKQSTTSQSLPQWQIGSQDQSTECQIQQEQRSAQQQEQPLPGMELKQHESAAETQQHQSASQQELNHLQMPDKSQDQ